jgi:hypothetical protein
VSSRLRKPGGGRKRLSETDPQLNVELDRLVAPRGDPESAQRWTYKSRRGKESCPSLRQAVCLVEVPGMGHLYRLNQESKVVNPQ